MPLHRHSSRTAAMRGWIESSAERYGALTPRQRPYRHGRYHRALEGLVSGTLSIPEVPQGWQRNSLASVIHPPAHSPKRSIASSP
jgi:hypothetical protein